MSSEHQRRLDLLLASADLAIEISPQSGLICLALGACKTLTGPLATDLIGRSWRAFIDAQDLDMMAMVLEGLEPGRRSAPVLVRLAGLQEAATLRAYRAAQSGSSIACAFSRARFEPARFAGGLADRTAFESFAGNLLGPPDAVTRDLELTLLELRGLGGARMRCAMGDRQDLDARVVALLRAEAWGGSAAVALGHDRFALIRQAGEIPRAFEDRLERLLAAPSIKPYAASIAAKGPQHAQQISKTLRYILERFSTPDLGWSPPGDFAEAFGLASEHALPQASALGAAITERNFRLAYQPVFELQSRTLHHFEVLVRFGADESPFPQIKMAEELDLIEALDFAILERTAEVMTAKPGVRLAVNVSGRTIISPNYIERALRLVERLGLGGRLMFELTESAAIDDLALADRHIQALRRAGCEVCLDDFGAGAASFAYLQQLRLDVVKIDGRYIRDLQFAGRGSTFIKHLVHMCREMGMKTLAEMVETSTIEDEVRRAGVDLAQGWLYGLASERPEAALPMAPLHEPHP